MDQEKFIEYFNIIKDLYRKKDISIEWFKSNFRFSTNIKLEEFFEKQTNDLNHEEFKDVVLEVVKLIRDIATGEDLSNYAEWKKNLVKENFLTEDELAHINVMSTSNVDTVKQINQEILTKRSISDIHKVKTFSVLISMELRNATEELINFELSKKQLVTLIEDLKGSLTAIEELENIHQNGGLK